MSFLFSKKLSSRKQDPRFEDVVLTLMPQGRAKENGVS